MLEEEEALVRHRLERARQTLLQAETLLEHKLLDGVVNRIYYACFYAVLALLYSEGLRSSKHGGVIALFNQHFIKPGRLPVEIGDFYQLMFEKRQTGDYKDFITYDETSLRSWLDQARLFVDKVSATVAKASGIDVD